MRWLEGIHVRVERWRRKFAVYLREYRLLYFDVLVDGNGRMRLPRRLGLSGIHGMRIRCV
jgi:hypothetical protein